MSKLGPCDGESTVEGGLVFTVGSACDSESILWPWVGTVSCSSGCVDNSVDTSIARVYDSAATLVCCSCPCSSSLSSICSSSSKLRETVPF